MPRTLTRWDPFAELGELRSRFDRMFEDDILTISGEHEERAEEKDNDNYVRRERRYGSFSRSMALPVGIDAKKIKASTRSGVVAVMIPLPKEASKEPVRIIPTLAS